MHTQDSINPDPRALLETLSAAPPDSPLLDSPSLAPLAPLPDDHQKFLDFYFANGESPEVVAAKCNASLSMVLAWLTRPDIDAYVRALRTIRIQRQRDDALAELQHIVNRSNDPIERRRAAGTLLRATDPARWARLKKLARAQRITNAAGASPSHPSEPAAANDPQRHPRPELNGRLHHTLDTDHPIRREFILADDPEPAAHEPTAETPHDAPDASSRQCDSQTPPASDPGNIINESEPRALASSETASSGPDHDHPDSTDPTPTNPASTDLNHADRRPGSGDPDRQNPGSEPREPPPSP